MDQGGVACTLGRQAEAASQDQGYPGPFGVEVLSEELRNNPIDVIFERAYRTTAAQFEHERSSR